jgi:hypothetical protein
MRLSMNFGLGCLLALGAFACSDEDTQTVTQDAAGTTTGGGDADMVTQFDAASQDTGAQKDAGTIQDAANAVDAAVVLPAGAVKPQGYLGAFASPFSGVDFVYFHLEDFEDSMLNTPGVTNVGGRQSSTFSASIIDSVDADDGNPTDNRCIKPVGTCDAFFGNGTLTFTFDGTALGGLPTHAGAVWTDGSGLVGFEAFGADGKLAYEVKPFSEPGFPGGAYTSDTAEDRFFGAYVPGGISSIRIYNTAGGVEVDHLQYGRAR